MPDPIATAAEFVRLLEVEVQQSLTEVRLTLPRYAALCRADGVSASDLAHQAGVTQQAMAKTVRDLWLVGYVMKVPSKDRRRHLLKVTDRGRTALDQAQALDFPAALVAAMESYVAEVRS